MKRIKPPLHIAKPCPKRWDELQGDDRKRFCGECQLHVHNLSAMPVRERNEFVAQSGGRLCIAYVQRPDGSMVTPSTWAFWRKIFAPIRWALASALAMLLPGCASRATLGRPSTVGKPGPSCPTHQQKNVRANDAGAMTLGEYMPVNPSPQSKASPH